VAIKSVPVEDGIGGSQFAVCKTGVVAEM
jgi:hypothetical protein